MKPLLYILAALMLLHHAFSLQCYECTNSPHYPGVPDCNSDSDNTRTCDQQSERCMTMNYNMSLGPQGSMLVVVKNCSSITVCNPQFRYNWCKAFELVEQASNCSFDCCQGNLCNGLSSKSLTTPKPVCSVLGFSANFRAIFLSLVLTALAR